MLFGASTMLKPSWSGWSVSSLTNIKVSWETRLPTEWKHKNGPNHQPVIDRENFNEWGLKLNILVHT